MQWAREDFPGRVSLCWYLNSRLDFDRDGGNDGKNSLIKGWEMTRAREIKGSTKGFGGSEAEREDTGRIGVGPWVPVRGGFILG